MKDHIKQFPKKLPGTFWGITAFFNPAGYQNKYENYLKFRESSSNQGLKLCTVELAFGNRPFEMKKNDADILLQLRTDKKNSLWQKERLLNIGFKNLPIDCDKISWLDCDILFENDDWLNETIKLLEKYIVVQPYSFVSRLNMGESNIENADTLPFGDKDGQIIHSMGYGVSHLGKDSLSNYMKHGHTGYAWSSRKEVFDKYGFYDSLIIGAGDLFMSNAFFNNHSAYIDKLPPDKLRKDYIAWAKKLYNKVKGSVYYSTGLLQHLWHGDYKDRFYMNRYDTYKVYDFDPKKDIKKDINDVWEWSSGKVKLHADIRRYFIIRREDKSLYHTTLAYLHKNMRPIMIALLIWQSLNKNIRRVDVFLKKHLQDYITI